jgi:hypothetical protein
VLVGQLMSLAVDAIPRSSLPDDVFDPGEKQKPALKRPIQKVSHLLFSKLLLKNFPWYKGTEKADKESPDLPNKRRK